MLYYADADGSGTGNGRIKLVRSTAPAIPTLTPCTRRDSTVRGRQFHWLQPQSECRGTRTGNGEASEDGPSRIPLHVAAPEAALACNRPGVRTRCANPGWHTLGTTGVHPINPNWIAV